MSDLSHVEFHRSGIGLAPCGRRQEGGGGPRAGGAGTLDAGALLHLRRREPGGPRDRPPGALPRTSSGKWELYRELLSPGGAVLRPRQAGALRPGEETLLDRDVRDTWEVPKRRVKIDRRRWKRALAPALDAFRAELGLPDGCRLSAELHSMLVYGPGQFFRRHQDSEKADDMVGTLVVTLPSSFRGGALVVEHRGARASFRGSKKHLSLVAFYADCHHEVRPATQGHRVTLTYNLTLEGGGIAGDSPAAEADPATVDGLADLLDRVFRDPGRATLRLAAGRSSPRSARPASGVLHEGEDDS